MSDLALLVLRLLRGCEHLLRQCRSFFVLSLGESFKLLEEFVPHTCHCLVFQVWGALLVLEVLEALFLVADEVRQVRVVARQSRLFQTVFVLELTQFKGELVALTLCVCAALLRLVQSNL